MDVRLNATNPRNPVTAVMHCKPGSFLSLDFEQSNGNSVSIFLPPHMEAVAAMIVGAFNAHMTGERPADGKVIVDLYEDGQVIGMRVEPGIPAGGALNTKAATAMAIALAQGADISAAPRPEPVPHVVAAGRAS